jgi:hypothetical protein
VRFWEELIKVCEEQENDWVNNELPKFSIEDSRTADLRGKAVSQIAGQIGNGQKNTGRMTVEGCRCPSMNLWTRLGSVWKSKERIILIIHFLVLGPEG